MKLRGFVSLAFLLLMIGAITILGGGAAFTALNVQRNVQTAENSMKSYYASQAGIEDASYRIIKGLPYPSSYTLGVGLSQASVIITGVGNQRIVESQGQINDIIKKLKITFTLSSLPSPLIFATQVGNGGVRMKNTSQIIGNVYSNGNITGENSPVINGDAASGGTISNPPTVTGIRTQGAPLLSMPISDSQLDAWETQAQAGGTIPSPCPYIPADGSSLGPIKIDCDLIIDGTKIITMTGTIWVKGNFYIENSAKLKLAPSYGSSSGIIIVDNPSNRSTSSKIIVQNSSQILGSGTAGSYVLVVSRNNSAELGGNESAIDVKNSSSAPIYYAPHGMLEIQNSASLKEATAYKLSLENSTTLTYETGIASTQFSSGPSASFEISSWNEL